MTRSIYYTGDLITPDGSDTGVYGDGCEEGSGQTLTMGWVDPDYSRFTVHAERESVRPDVYVEDGDESPGAWLARTVSERLGAVEDATADWFTATDDDIDYYRTDARMRLAAHPEGFSDAELAEASRLLAGERSAMTWR